VAGLEDAVVTLGQLTTGALVERGTRKWQVRRSTRRVPIYLAAEGPRTLELAGRVADGVIVGLGLTPEVISVSLAAIERGARAAGRTLEDLDVWWFAKTNVADTREAAVAPIKMALAASANHAFRFTLEGKAVPPDLHERIQGLQKEYDAHQHEIAGAANADLTERWGLTEFLRDRFGIAGTPEDCVAQVRRAMAAGARQFIIAAFVPDVRALMRRFMREVAAAIGRPR
jgi:5,10-methylenetetrahydromethanopterin reductase